MYVCVKSGYQRQMQLNKAMNTPDHQLPVDDTTPSKDYNSRKIKQTHGT